MSKRYQYHNSARARATHYENLYETQNGLCAICRKHFNRLSIDHDHETGMIRELLCHTCNYMLGNAKDSVLILERAIEYIVKHRTYP